jgi:hypothetical protein
MIRFVCIGGSREQMRLLTQMGAREVALTSDADDALIFDGELQGLTPTRPRPAAGAWLWRPGWWSNPGP